MHLRWFGFMIGWLLKKSKDKEQAITTGFGLFLLLIGLSIVIRLDVIIVALLAGLIVTNRYPYSSEHFFGFMRGIANPVYVLFFVMTGARLTLANMPGWLWLSVVLFVIARSLGKVIGSYLGARISSAGRVVRRYIGLSLFSQGGVSIGLAIVAGQHLNNISVSPDFALGDTIILVTTTTSLIQLIGPSSVNIASRLSKETGVRITIDDLIKSRKVGEVLPPLAPQSVLTEQTTIIEAVNVFFTVNADLLPVTDENSKVVGMVTFNDIRQILANYSLWSWSLVSDIMNLDVPILSPDQGVKEAMNLSNTVGYTQIPVVQDENL